MSTFLLTSYNLKRGNSMCIYNSASSRIERMNAVQVLFLLEPMYICATAVSLEKSRITATSSPSENSSSSSIILIARWHTSGLLTMLRDIATLRRAVATSLAASALRLWLLRVLSIGDEAAHLQQGAAGVWVMGNKGVRSSLTRVYSAGEQTEQIKIYSTYIGQRVASTKGASIILGLVLPVVH